MVRILFIRTDLSPYGVISVFEYPNIDIKFESRLLNWDNLIRCSNYYGYTPEELTYDNKIGYMGSAVFEGKKPAATFRYPIHDRYTKEMINKASDDILVVP